jgi:hypothetical protein
VDADDHPGLGVVPQPLHEGAGAGLAQAHRARRKRAHRARRKRAQGERDGVTYDDGDKGQATFAGWANGYISPCGGFLVTPSPNTPPVARELGLRVRHAHAADRIRSQNPNATRSPGFM